MSSDGRAAGSATGTGDRLDLDGPSRTALELDALLEWVAGLARTAPGADRVRATTPSADPAVVGARLELLAAGIRRHDGEGSWVPSGLPDPRPALAQLGTEGGAAELASLVDLALTLRAASDLGASLDDPDVETPGGLAALGRSIPDLRLEANAVLDGVEHDGRLADGASPELRALRRRLERTGDRLRRRLQELLHAPDAEAVIRDDFVTQRNGRYVIPVRSDAPRAVEGIVHASSSSGATRFVEPLETIELNNELVALAEEAREEERRIVARWSAAFRDRAAEVEAAVEGLARLDALQARVLFGGEIEGTIPRAEAGGTLLLTRVRHPLLDRRLREQGGRCVPLDIELDPADRVLVLSGPNAGGKTVALKTAGLAALMAQSGLPVAAREARLPIYRQLRADIGDHQSIHADLSTYSAHVRAVADFIGSIRAPALLLFDEIGTGTDPGEGAALSRAVLEELQRDGVTVMATTHQGALKSWAFLDERASSAAMEFDAETLRPTFRILAGSAGASAGLDVAERLGLPAAVVARARRHLGEPGARSESYMSRLRELTAELEERRDALRQEEARLAERRRELEAEARAEESRRRERAQRELERVVRELRREARAGLAAIAATVDERERRRAQRETARLEGALERRKARELADDAGRGWRVPDLVEPGLQVRVRSLGRDGLVERVRGENVDVRMGQMVFTVERSDLRVAPGGGERETPREKPRRPQAGAVRGRPAAPEPAELPEELILIGMRVEEGLEALDRFLDDCVLHGRRQVRVVHGHGTGRLRRAVREHLAGHVHVRSRRPGKDYEGGDGATIVELR